ncbi:LamG-like jellyroll fold domain-containing protein [Flavobacteriaceae bacterium S356]|uniref:LamG-like jellyroll fold domain-containing protein n=1 Tax=Asprobacillus argus TaxID=3076534 RepID=A0ABU3LFD9_9FLAO|nr:LamG-like jellyroll fold domain-containing protein [Flavobacteriaceae bacterium S356]
MKQLIIPGSLVFFTLLLCSNIHKVKSATVVNTKKKAYSPRLKPKVNNRTDLILENPIMQTLSGSTTATCAQNHVLTLEGSQTDYIYTLRNDLDNSTIGGWKQGTGGSLSFQTGNVNSTTNYHVYAQKDFGHTLNFDGVEEFVGFGTHTNLPTGNGARTIEAWIKTGGTGNYAAIVNYGTTSNGERFALLVSDDNKLYFAGEFNDLKGATTITDNQWHHVAVTYDSTTIRLYVDGVEDGNANLALNTTNGFFMIGKRNATPNTENFSGQIDEVRIWNVARTQQEISSNQFTSYTGSENNLVSYYTFDEGSGVIINDLTSSNNDGDLLLMEEDDWVYRYSTGSIVSNVATITRVNFSTQTLAGGGNISCAQDNTLSLSSSETCATYYLRNDADNSIIGNGQIGTGGSLTFQTGIVSNTTDFHIYAESQLNNALELDGTDDFISVSSFNNLPNGNSPRTMEAWVKTNGTGAFSAIANYGTNSNTQRFGLLVNPNGKLYFVGSFADLEGTSVITDNAWHHVAVTYNGSTIKLYVDGVLENSSAITLNTLHSSFTIGKLNSSTQNDEHFTGQLDEIRIWDDVRTQEEIVNNAYTKFLGNEANLVSYYNFDSSSGTTLDDLSSSNNDGVLTHMDNSDWVPKDAQVGNIVSNTQTITLDLPIAYVDANATGSNTGCDWANAYTSIANALQSVNSGGEVRIAKGTYTTASTLDITKSVTIKGGYPSGGGAQNSALNSTIISGNNSHRVMSSITNNLTIHVQGLTISNGKTTGATEKGAGIRFQVASGEPISTITMEDCIIKNNSSDLSGGGIYNAFNSLTINNCVVKNNTAGNTTSIPNAGGGGILNEWGVMTLLNTAIEENQVLIAGNDPSNNAFGGGLLNILGQVTIINGIVKNNIINAGSSNYDQLSGGAISNNTSSSFQAYNTLIQENKILSTFNNNHRGAAVHSDSNISFINCTIVKNSISGSNTNSYGGGIYMTSGVLTLQNSILADNTATNNNETVLVPGATQAVTYSYIKDQNPIGTGNIDDSSGLYVPDFANAGSNYRLQHTSTLIDAGGNTYLPVDTYDIDGDGNTSETLPTDLDNKTRLFSSTVDIGAYENDGPVSNWTGSVDSNWSNPSNWTGALLPTNSSTVLLNSNITIDINNAVAKDLIMLDSHVLTISPGKSLTIENDFTNRSSLMNTEDAVIIESDASSSGSLIIKGNATGNISYKRYVTDSWHLITAPLSGQSIYEFTVTEAASNDVAQNGDLTKYAIAPYDNTVSSNNWNYILVSDIANAGEFVQGKGYAMKRNTPGTFTFVGEYLNTDTTSIISDQSNQWNLVGNPYPSYLATNVSANTTNILSQNLNQLDPAFGALYVWNSSTNSYDIINNALGATYIAPGQSFFVNSKSGGGTISLQETMQSHQTGDLFLRATSSTNFPHISISFSNGTLTKSTDIKYIEGTTSGLDTGYDAGLFDGNTTDFNIATHLIEDSEGVDFALQCLPPNNYDTLIIPLSVKADTGQEVTFSIELNNFPANVPVYLEDKETNTFTQLDDPNTEYTISLSENLNGIGRFYLHTTENALNVEGPKSLTQVHIYMESSQTLNVSGIYEKDANMDLYNLLGQKVFSTSFTGKGSNSISIPAFNKGIYIVHIITETGRKSTKIVLK